MSYLRLSLRIETRSRFLPRFYDINTLAESQAFSITMTINNNSFQQRNKDSSQSFQLIDH